MTVSVHVSPVLVFVCAVVCLASGLSIFVTVFGDVMTSLVDHPYNVVVAKGGYVSKQSQIWDVCVRARVFVCGVGSDDLC